jgi:hypothetical protein
MPKINENELHDNPHPVFEKLKSSELYHGQSTSEKSESKPQICYKTDELCKFDCKGLCKESC